jgi:TRAP-type mannitol/chloroaromatic compound transport system permease small subunit
MNRVNTIAAWIEKISEWTGKCGSWLTAVLMMSIGYEVVMRYGFGAPTDWSYDISYMLGGSLYLLGMSWVLRDDGNIRVDIVSSMFSERTQLIINLFFSVVLFFPMAIMLFKVSLERTIHSWRILEKASYTIWYPPIYPLRTLVTIAFLVWILQGIATFYKNVRELIGEKS